MWVRRHGYKVPACQSSWRSTQARACASAGYHASSLCLLQMYRMIVRDSLSQPAPVRAIPFSFQAVSVDGFGE